MPDWGQARLPHRNAAILHFLITAVFLLITTSVMTRLAREVHRERERSEYLLESLFPAKIVQQLKESDRPVAEKFDSVTVLFADIAGFTPLSSSLSAEKIVDVLNRLFTKFDRLVDQYGLEKVKTIGDAYMVAGGVPEPRSDHAAAVADLALAMQEVVGQAQPPGEIPMKLRIGIHTGPLVAGVIGRKKFRYDLWGDTVNTASRMESHGEVGRIQVSKDVFLKLKDDFKFVERGPVMVKGKGELVTYFLVGRVNRPS
jgi:class 3 adenylate cyclase